MYSIYLSDSHLYTLRSHLFFSYSNIGQLKGGLHIWHRGEKQHCRKRQEFWFRKCEGEKLIPYVKGGKGDILNYWLVLTCQEILIFPLLVFTYQNFPHHRVWQSSPVIRSTSNFAKFWWGDKWKKERVIGIYNERTLFENPNNFIFYELKSMKHYIEGKFNKCIKISVV